MDDGTLMAELSTEPKRRYTAQFALIEGTLPGADLSFVRNARKHALERFSVSGFPTQKHEDWKYTDITPVIKQPFQLGIEPSITAPKDLIKQKLFAELDSYVMVFVDGIYDPMLSQNTCQIPEIKILSLADAFVHIPEIAKTFLEKESFSIEHNAFANLNLAFMTGGAVIYLPANAVLDKPLHLLFVGNTTNKTYHVRNLIYADIRSQATVIEHYIGLGDARYFTNTTTELILKDNACVEHYKLQQENTKAFHIGALYSHQHRGSRLVSHSIALGAALSRNEIATRFDDERCECVLNGLYMANARQHVDHHTRIDHAAPRGTSNEFYRGVLSGAARGVFNGKVIVHPDAQHTDAHQYNHNLLLSAQAEIDTKPQLEIYADDVKCSHGATVGQLDEDMLFYLQSRGLQKETAISLLTYAFAHDIIERLKLKPIINRLEDVLINQLPGGAYIKELV